MTFSPPLCWCKPKCPAKCCFGVDLTYSSSDQATIDTDESPSTSKKEIPTRTLRAQINSNHTRESSASSIFFSGNWARVANAKPDCGFVLKGFNTHQEKVPLAGSRICFLP